MMNRACRLVSLAAILAAVVALVGCGEIPNPDRSSIFSAESNEAHADSDGKTASGAVIDGDEAKDGKLPADEPGDKPAADQVCKLKCNSELPGCVVGPDDPDFAELCCEEICEPADEPTKDKPPADEPTKDEPPADEPTKDEPPADEPTKDEPPAEDPKEPSEPTCKLKCDPDCAVDPSHPYYEDKCCQEICW